MASTFSSAKAAAAAKNMFVARTNAGIWVRLLFLFTLCNIVGIVFSLLFFLNVRGIGNRVIESSVDVPEVREVDKGHVSDILRAFSNRAALFQGRLSGGVSIPDPY